ncbi:hypothetical protein CA850_01340 [Micromonospora echinospora]|nr:hypothetical protein CA850_01340 [Micromonospora echinospora]
MIAQEVVRCSPPRDQADMIKLYEADPLLAVAPHDGQLVDEYAHSFTCDSGHGGSPTGPGFAEVMRRYQTPDAYSVDQLRQRFDEPATAAGWRIVRDRTDPQHEPVIYCKQTGRRASYARVFSSPYTVHQGGSAAGPGIELVIGAAGDGTRCVFDVGGQFSAPPEN